MSETLRQPPLEEEAERAVGLSRFAQFGFFRLFSDTFALECVYVIMAN